MSLLWLIGKLFFPTHGFATQWGKIHTKFLLSAVVVQHKIPLLCMVDIPEQLVIKIVFQVQGVSHWSVFFNLALRERNIQVRLYLKVVLKFWDVDILIFRTNFWKSNLGCPQQQAVLNSLQQKRVQNLKNYISWFH